MNGIESAFFEKIMRANKKTEEEEKEDNLKCIQV